MTTACIVRVPVTRPSARRGSFQERVTIPRTCLPTSSGTLLLLRVGTNRNELIGTETNSFPRLKSTSATLPPFPILCAVCTLGSSEHSPNREPARPGPLWGISSSPSKLTTKQAPLLDESQAKAVSQLPRYRETCSVQPDARALSDQQTDRRSRASKTSTTSASSGPCGRAGLLPIPLSQSPIRTRLFFLQASDTVFVFDDVRCRRRAAVVFAHGVYEVLPEGVLSSQGRVRI